MALHNQLGKQGELLALNYFTSKEFNILHCNWRCRKWEVDIIASHKGILHFIEVKTRSSDRFGHPEENVDQRKINHLINASEIYLQQNPEWKRIQFDVLAITISPVNVEFFYIEDVYL